MPRIDSIDSSVPNGISSAQARSSAVLYERWRRLPEIPTMRGMAGPPGRFASTSLAPLQLARYPVVVPVHLSTRAILQEERRFGAGGHLRAGGPTIAAEVLELLPANRILERLGD